MIENYIRVYDNAIPDEYCDDLIKRFDANKESHDIVSYDSMRSFTQINLNEHDSWRSDVNGLMLVYKNVLDRYKIDCNITEEMFPKEYHYEQVRMKRYMPNDIDQFNDHVDVGNHDSARRFLVFFIYLTDNEDGQTEFTQFGISVKPKKGRILIFPPLWNYLHAGKKVKKDSKYIIGSYLHYV
jgi:hypothetical protein